MNAMARQIVGRLHVFTSDVAVIRACSRAIKRKHRFAPEHKRDRKRFYRMALQAHAANRKLYLQVMGGLI